MFFFLLTEDPVPLASDEPHPVVCIVSLSSVKLVNSAVPASWSNKFHASNNPWRLNRQTSSCSKQSSSAACARSTSAWQSPHLQPLPLLASISSARCCDTIPDASNSQNYIHGAHGIPFGFWPLPPPSPPQQLSWSFKFVCSIYRNMVRNWINRSQTVNIMWLWSYATW